MVEIDNTEEYKAARRVLLDALEALGLNRKALVLIGAQAIYLHVGEGDLALAPYTTDADLLIHPKELEDIPNLSKTLENAGFKLSIKPGTWTMESTNVQLDFIVPATLGGGGRRGARLGSHGNEIARKTTGLEACIVDRTLVMVKSMDPGNSRSFEIFLAGPASLLVAKLFKISERMDKTDRLQDKDGLDIFRILRGIETRTLCERLDDLSEHPTIGKEIKQARKFFEEFFSKRDGIGTQMVLRSVENLEDAEEIALSCQILSSELLNGWKKR